MDDIAQGTVSSADFRRSRQARIETAIRAMRGASMASWRCLRPRRELVVEFASTIPVVLCVRVVRGNGRSIPSDPELSRSAEMVAHLIRAGTSDRGSSRARRGLRRGGKTSRYRMALREAGIDRDPVLERKATSLSGGYSAVIDLLALKTSDGIFAANDSMR